MNIFLRDDGKLRAGWRLAVSVLVMQAAAWLSVVLAGLLTSSEPRLRFVAVQRSLMLLFLFAGFSVLLITLDRVRQRPLAAMGLGLRQRWVLQSLAGIALGALMVVAGVAAVAVGGTLKLQFSINGSTLRLAVVVLLGLAAAAMAEEVMFRGYPFQRLVEGMGAAGAIVVSSTFFGLVHARNPSASFWSVLNTVLFGVLLAIAYLRSRSLWLPWGMHFGWNAALGVGFGLPVSGITWFAALGQGRAEGPKWLTGGDYGLEASAVGSVLIVVAIAAVVALTRLPALRAPDDSPPPPPHLGSMAGSGVAEGGV